MHNLSAELSINQLTDINNYKRCGHCKSLAPHWSAAAKTLKSSPVKLAKVDATEHKVLFISFQLTPFDLNFNNDFIGTRRKIRN